MDQPKRQGSSSSQHHARPPLHSHNHSSGSIQRVRFAEEQPGLEVYQPPPPAKATRETISPDVSPDVSPNTSPDVYWVDERDNDANLAKYTFYREGTPTPPEYAENEKSAGGAAGRIPPPVAPGRPPAARHDSGIPGGFPPFDPAGDSDGSLAESLDDEPPRRKFPWLIMLGVALLVIAIVVGVGVGVGVATKRQSVNAEAASSGTASPNASGPTVTTSAPSTTRSSATSASSASLPTLLTKNSDCPAANNTMYAAPGSSKRFLRLCGRDYSGGFGATDLAHVLTSNMSECINKCASFDKCTACGWGYLPGDQGDAHRCWMKTNLQSSNKAADDYCFAILQ